MTRYNSLLPTARAARDTLATTGDGTVTVQGIRAHLYRDVEAYEQLVQSIDLKQATRSLANAAIRTAIEEWPAYEVEGGYVHLDPSQQWSSQVWSRVLALRRKQRGHIDEAIVDLENRLDAALLREQLQNLPLVETPVEH